MNIYLLKNFTLKEQYFGLAAGECREAVTELKGIMDSPVGHWKWDAEEIKWGTVDTDLSEAYAHAFIQALRREPPDKGWVVLVGDD